jgi:hypothetical protein
MTTMGGHGSVLESEQECDCKARCVSKSRAKRVWTAMSASYVSPLDGSLHVTYGILCK